jgi:hypothetical protein
MTPAVARTFRPANLIGAMFGQMSRFESLSEYGSAHYELSNRWGHGQVVVLGVVSVSEVGYGRCSTVWRTSELPH